MKNFESYIKCGDCLVEMNNIDKNSVDIVLTSPPYNIGRKSEIVTDKRLGRDRYDEYIDAKSNDEYIDWMVDIFNKFDDILVTNGVVLFNFSYATNSVNTAKLIYSLIYKIMNQTSFMVADTICWKKNNAFPNAVSHNKLTRIWEFIFVFCRENEFSTFRSNKKVKSIRNNGQKMYENVFNFIEAKNNDNIGSKWGINAATFSTDLVGKLLDIYCYSNDNVVLDPFLGSGTTAVECVRRGVNFIGIEISKKQVDFAIKRIFDTLKNDE